MGVELEPTTGRAGLTSGPDPDAGPLTFPLSVAGGILAGMATATSPAFIGRATELGRLLAMLERAGRGRPAVALVAGDAGVGKTRLLAELAGRAEGRGVRVLVGGCMEVGDLGLPYVPFVDAFRDLGSRPGEAELAAPLVAAVPALGKLLPRAGEDPASTAPGSSDGFEQVQLLDSVLTLLVRLSDLAPLLLVIEDLHWADRSTRDLLAFLVRTLRSGRIALVASYRSDELHRRHPLRPLLAELVRVPDLERVELSAFNRAELTEYLEVLVGGQVSSAAIDRILRRSEGNAFFAEELVAAGAVRAEVLLPEALADVLLGRVEALSELAREVLKVAAVAGRRVGHSLLVAAAALPEPKLEQGLREAIAAQLLVTDPVNESYRFRHALLQEVVYGDLLPGERTRLHATYARVLADRVRPRSWPTTAWPPTTCPARSPPWSERRPTRRRCPPPPRPSTTSPRRSSSGTGCRTPPRWPASTGSTCCWTPPMPPASLGSSATRSARPGRPWRRSTPARTARAPPWRTSSSASTCCRLTPTPTRRWPTAGGRSSWWTPIPPRRCGHV